MPRSPDIPAPLTTPYYHGTSALAAVCIAVDGFRLLPNSLRNWRDGALGNGIYVTAVLETASFFAELGDRRGVHDSNQYVVRVRTSPGTRLLRLDGLYDRRVIDYLGREFGKDLFTPKFDRAIPANKHLTRVELIHLANYLWSRGEKDKPGGIAAWSGLEDQGPLRRYLMKHKYDGIGCPETDIGVVVFNPSCLVSDGVFQLDRHLGVPPNQTGAHCLAPFEPVQMATGAAASIRSNVESIPELHENITNDEANGKKSLARLYRDESAAILSEIPRWQNCLRAFCKRHDILITGQAIASALAAVEQ